MDCPLEKFAEWNTKQPYLSNMDKEFLNRQYGGFC